MEDEDSPGIQPAAGNNLIHFIAFSHISIGKQFSCVTETESNAEPSEPGPFSGARAVGGTDPIC